MKESTFIHKRHGRRSGRVRGKMLLLAALYMISCFVAGHAFALGTPAGTVIGNTATVIYTMSGNNYTTSSNTNAIRVDDKVNFTLTASNVSDVAIAPGGRASMAYILTNTGNGPHDFTLKPAVTGVPTLVPAAGPAFYADTAGTAALPADPNANGLPYISALAPDASRTVYLYITAPAQPVDGQAIDYLVTAEAYQPANLGVVNPPVKSSTAAAAGASANKNANLMTQYVVLGDGHGNGGDADRDGLYAVLAKDGSGNTVGFKAQAATVTVAKTAVVTDQYGGSQPMTGATIRYTLSVTASGSGTAMNVVVTDAVPANTTYVPGTLKLNGTALSDALDSDAGDVGGTTPGSVTVTLGNLTSTSPVQTITFAVRIN